MKGTLVIVRHGQSRFNELNIFTGWLDVPLSEKGIEQAHSVSTHCENFDYDVVFTSHLKRAHETLSVILSKQIKIGVFQHQSDKQYDISDNLDSELSKNILKVYTDKTLNERSYGTLQGMNKEKAREVYGEEQVFNWRRGYTDKPPEGESLKDVCERAVPYFEKTVIPHLESGETCLIVGHGNTLRALIKFLENIEDEKIPFVNLPLGRPLVYEYINGSFKRTEGEYEEKGGEKL